MLITTKNIIFVVDFCACHIFLEIAFTVLEESIILYVIAPLVSINVVKGINLEGLRVLGNPQYFSEIYYKAGADEIIYHDVVASLYQRKYLLDIISKTSQNCFT